MSLDLFRGIYENEKKKRNLRSYGNFCQKHVSLMDFLVLVEYVKRIPTISERNFPQKLTEL